MKIITNEDFDSSKSLGIYNCQTWVFHNFRETENLFIKDLVVKCDLILSSTTDKSNIIMTCI